MPLQPYVELHLHTNYSLLEGASHPEEMIERAAALGYHALAVTDRNNLYGALVFAQECKAHDIQPITGLELTTAPDPDEGPSLNPAGRRHDLTLLAATRRGYANLCRLASLANGHFHTCSPGPPWPGSPDRERRRTDPCLPVAQLTGHAEGVICLTGGRRSEVAAAVAAGDLRAAEQALWRWIELFGAQNVFVELQHNLVHGDLTRNRALVALARTVGVGVVATGDVHYHVRERHRLHDALTAIKHRTTLDGSHRLRRSNGEFYLRAPQEQAERFAEWPEAVATTLQIARRCTFDITENLGYRLPSPPVPDGHTPDSWLEQLCRESLAAKYGAEERAAAEARLEEELRLITQHGLAGFFLVYHEVLELAREVAAEVRGDSPRGRVGLPPGRGRGSSVGSIVCYLIGLSHIDPIRNRLFLGRFLNEDMSTLPDIDLDFPRDIRDRLFQRVYERWGSDHAALVATFPRYRIRSAVRDLGKALGLPASELDRLAKLADGYGSARDLREEMLRNPQFRSLVDAPGWRELIELAHELADFPRHLSQHVGGVVIASDPLIDCVPIVPAAWPGRYVCHWDKDSIDDAGMVKIDFLALGMLSLVEECLDLCAEHRGDLVDLSRIDFEDRRVYDRIGRGDTVGVFQIESRAQAGMLPRTQPRNLDDLTAQVAIIRPGPIVGGSVHAFVARRRPAGPPWARRSGSKPEQPEEAPAIPHECVREALEETLGVVLYQEQVIQVAMAMGGFTPGEAEAFRRAMGRRKGREAMASYRDKFLAGARVRGVPEETARAMFEQLLGFAEFGFPKSHASAFALLAYQSAWLKEYYAPEFYCALYNNWPMGFYPPHVFTNDAKRHGVRVLRPDINRSNAKCTLEPDPTTQPMAIPENVDPVRAVRVGTVAPSLSSLVGASSVGATRVPAFPPRGWVPRRRLGCGPPDSQGSVPREHPTGDHPGMPLQARPKGLGYGVEVQATGGRKGSTSHAAVRIGLGYIHGVGEAGASIIVAERERAGPYRSLWDFVHRTRLTGSPVENAIRIGAFDAFGGVPSGSRRELLWQLGLIERRHGPESARPAGRGVRQTWLELPTKQDEVRLANLSAYERMAADYEVLGLSPDAHPMRFLRKTAGRVPSSRHLRSQRPGSRTEVAGLVVCRQRPGTAHGTVFLLLEDEDGMVNVIIAPRLYERERPLLRTTPLLRVRGILEGHAGDVPTVRAQTVYPLLPPTTLRTPDGKNWG